MTTTTSLINGGWFPDEVLAVLVRASETVAIQYAMCCYANMSGAADEAELYGVD
jgi:hypothetical protein